MYNTANIYMSLVPPVSTEVNWLASDGYLYTDAMANNRSVKELTKVAMRRFNRFKTVHTVNIYVNGNSMAALGAVIEACKRMDINLELYYSRNEDGSWNKQSFYFMEFVEICDD